VRVYRAREGPFAERPYFTLQEIESICSDELKKAELYPKEPSPIRIDRFIEKKFEIQISYQDLPEGLLGYTKFGPKGVEEIAVSRGLAEEGNRASERRLSATIAHEAGHGLLHAHLFVLEPEQIRSLFGDGVDRTAPKILCREGNVMGSRGFPRKGYDGHWWEFQANQAIGALLLPRSLVQKAIERLMVERGSLGQLVLEKSRMVEAARQLSEAFEVNPIVAEIRVENLFAEENKQLTL